MLFFSRRRPKPLLSLHRRRRTRWVASGWRGGWHQGGGVVRRKKGLLNKLGLSVGMQLPLAIVKRLMHKCRSIVEPLLSSSLLVPIHICRSIVGPCNSWRPCTHALASWDPILTPGRLLRYVVRHRHWSWSGQVFGAKGALQNQEAPASEEIMIWRAHAAN